jgi:hypothetical protein
MFDEPAENKLLKLLKEGVMRETPEEDTEQRATDNRLLRILRDKKKTKEEAPGPQRSEEARSQGQRSAAEAPAAPRPRKSEEAAAPAPQRGEGRRDAKSILAASRVEDIEEPPMAMSAEDVVLDEAPVQAPTVGAAPLADRRDDSRPDDDSSLRRLVRATAEAPAPPRPTAPPSPAVPRKAAPGPSKPTPQAPPPPRPEPAAPSPAPPRAVETPRAVEPARAAPTADADAQAGPDAGAWTAPEGGLALTLLLKADQMDFIVKMAEGGGLVRTMLVMQCLMGGQGEWGLQGLLQEYARGVTGALNKLMIQEKMRKEVNLGAVKDADLDALLEEIRDTLDGDTSEGDEAAASVMPGLLLGVRLPREDVAFLRKLASPKGDLTLVSHLIFAQSLMAHEIVPSSVWPQGPAAARIREDFKAAVRTYRELQKTLLNQILVNARLGKKTTWGGTSAEKLGSALAELARTLKACLPQGV